MTRPRDLTAGLAAFAVAGASTALLATAATAAPVADRAAATRNVGALVSGQSYDRFLVHFTAGTPAATRDRAASALLAPVADLSLVRRISTGGVLLQAPQALDPVAADALLDAIAATPGVAFAEPDSRISITLSPDDPQYAAQWHYSEAAAGMNLPTAWDTADGAGVTVAVIDTGITDHSDLDANVVPGYDFISAAAEARDGDGRDADAADQGDWSGVLDCVGGTGSNSSWHGTHVAGTIAAVTGNRVGVSGVAFKAKVQPVRALGRCGGALSDIADAITWASGGTVAGIPANATPAKVINLSIGGSGSCGAAFQNAITGATSRGTTVVVAAGNASANASGYQPSSCTGTVVVAASDRQGNLASYSNFGAIVDLAAPGGETATTGGGVLSTLNAGTTTPGAESYAYYQGTSMATPHVAGLAALVLGEVPRTPAELEAILKGGTRPLPGTCSGGCGAGLADAGKTIASLGTGGTPTPTPTATPTPSPTPTATTPPTGQTLFTNSADHAIADLATAESPITVSGRTGNAPSALKVPVDIKHTYRGDLQVDLVAPDGTLYRLKSTSTGLLGDSADNVIQTFTVNASSEAANGTWKLRVHDAASGDTGFVDSWSLQF